MKRINKSKGSLIVAIAIVIYFVSWPFIYKFSNPFTWDTFGYYLYLPLSFIYHDLGISDYSIIENVQAKQFISDTLYQIYESETGDMLIRYPLGLSVLLSPFYLVGHYIAGFTHYSQDGFSLPYQLAIISGCLFYISTSILLIRKILLTWFNDNIVAITLLLICIGTNYMNQATVSSSMPHTLVFFIYTLIILFTIKWHNEKKVIYAGLLGGAIGLAVICRPTEIIAILIPLLWGVKNFGDLKNKIRTIWEYHKISLVIALVCGFFFVFLQMLYWKIYAGSFIFNSYNNPGEGLDLLAPHTIDFLFSFRKGWLIYTPIMVFAVIGFYQVKKKRPEFFWPLLVFTVLNVYLASSWTNWWYAQCFGQRAMVQSYVIMSIPLGFFIQAILKHRTKYKIMVFCGIFFFFALNIFQNWQANRGIIHGERMTFDYYMAVFGKTEIDKKKYEHLLLYDRSLTFQEAQLKYPYKQAVQVQNGFENLNIDNQISNEIFRSGTKALKIHSGVEFSNDYKISYSDLANTDHIWLKVSFWAYITDFNSGVRIVMAMWRHGKNYKYRAYNITEDIKKSDIHKWKKFTYYYLTPHIRSSNDKFQTYFWNANGAEMYVDDLEIIKYIPNNGIR